MLTLWLVILSVCSYTHSKSHFVVMREMSKQFGIVILNPCKQKLNLTENIIQDFRNFWRHDQVLDKKEVGCTVNCVEKELKLIDSNEQLNLPNVVEFMRANGADDEMIINFLNILQECRKVKSESEISEDICSSSLELANCFRKGCWERHWVPDI
ncbi:hypothetical protein ACJJTC_005495 [Scirpophaga incertulas]